MLTDEQMARRRRLLSDSLLPPWRNDERREACRALAEDWAATPPLLLTEGEIRVVENSTLPKVVIDDDCGPAVALRRQDIRPIAEWLLSLIGERIEARPEEGADGK